MATAFALAIGTNDDVILTGRMVESLDFGGGKITSQTNGLFYARINPNGDHEWSRAVGSGLRDTPPTIAVTPSGDVVMAAYTSLPTPADPMVAGSILARVSSPEASCWPASTRAESTLRAPRSRAAGSGAGCSSAPRRTRYTSPARRLRPEIGNHRIVRADDAAGGIISSPWRKLPFHFSSSRVPHGSFRYCSSPRQLPSPRAAASAARAPVAPLHRARLPRQARAAPSRKRG